jgi:two-component system LytT family response regulator
MIRALLIDDEAAARADLREKLARHPEVTVVGEAATMNSGRDLLQTAEYELVFLDVQLIGGSAFELVPYVRENAEIIFATGFDQYALRAFEINALDYLLKPIAPERLAESLNRLVPAPERTIPESGEEFTTGMQLQMSDVIYLRASTTAHFASLANVRIIAAKDNYSEVRLVDGTSAFLRKTLKSWEDALPPEKFMRIHRTQIANLTRIVRFERDRDEHTLLYMEGIAQPVPVSRYRWSELHRRIEALRRRP